MLKIDKELGIVGRLVNGFLSPPARGSLRVSSWVLGCRRAENLNELNTSDSLIDSDSENEDKSVKIRCLPNGRITSECTGNEVVPSSTI